MIRGKINLDKKDMADGKARNKAIIYALGSIIFIVGVGVVFFHVAEGLSRLDSLYFVVVSMSTIGYGDIVPITPFGKVLAMIYAVTGVPIFIYTTGLIVERRLRSVVSGYVKESTTTAIEEMKEMVQEEVKKHHEKHENTAKKKTQNKEHHWRITSLFHRKKKDAQGLDEL